MTRDHQLLKEAAQEIRNLRTSNEHMGTRLDMFDKMWTLFTSGPNFTGQAMGEDLAWKIDKHLESAKDVELKKYAGEPAGE